MHHACAALVTLREQQMLFSSKENASAATRTQDQSVKSRVLYLLSYGCIPTKVNRINRIYGPSRELRQCIQRCLLSLESLIDMQQRAAVRRKP